MFTLGVRDKKKKKKVLRIYEANLLSSTSSTGIQIFL